jgi:hypothetical protein
MGVFAKYSTIVQFTQCYSCSVSADKTVVFVAKYFRSA